MAPTWNGQKELPWAYRALQNFSAVQRGERVDSQPLTSGTEFTRACESRAIEILGKYFPEDAALIAVGKPPATIAHSPNGWMTRPMGEMLRCTEKCVARMRHFHPTEKDAQKNMGVYFELLCVVAREVEELAAWGRPHNGKREATTLAKGWMAGLPGCPKFEEATP
jgi:hypothetical protein